MKIVKVVNPIDNKEHEINIENIDHANAYIREYEKRIKSAEKTIKENHNTINYLKSNKEKYSESQWTEYENIIKKTESQAKQAEPTILFWKEITLKVGSIEWTKEEKQEHIDKLNAEKAKKQEQLEEEKKLAKEWLAKRIMITGCSDKIKEKLEEKMIEKLCE